MVFAFIIICICLCYETSSTYILKLNDGRDIPGIALGTWLDNDLQRESSEPEIEVEKQVTWALDCGYRHIDTAPVLGIEDQVGRAINNKIAEGLKREDIFITTKLPNDAHASEAVVPALKESLNRLNLDYVDLYLIHWPVGQFSNLTYDFTDYVETWRGMIEAKELGLAMSIGVANFNQDQIDRIVENGLETPAVLQIEINLNLQQPTLLEYCVVRNITVMGYKPCGSLWPSKALPNAPPPRAHDPAILSIVDNHNKTPAQLVMRYLIDLGVIPVPRPIHKHRIKRNINIFDFTLTTEEKTLLKGYDRHYRTMPQYKWMDHPHYPFERNNTII